MTKVAQRWTDHEFAGLALGDARLDKRARIMMERLSAKPTASIPQACDSWNETCAAYRFLGNDDVTWEGILAPHWTRTQERMSAHRVVLCIQDTTELDFNGQETEGLGPLNYEARRGMYLHPTYAVTPEREPLGVLDAYMWAREQRGADGVRPGQSESARWPEGYERLAEMAPEMPDTRLVYVADREADMVAMMRRARDLGTPVDWLVRAKHNRCLPDGGDDKLWAYTTKGEAVGEITFKMGPRDEQKARTVRQQVWSRAVEISDGKGGRITATCIVAREIGAPKGVKPVEWRLLTNRQASTVEQAIELIEWYRARWEIEIYFNVLKNGCEVEALQLSAIDRIERALALFMVVAWRITNLMRLGRTCPDLDAALFFDPDEIRGAYLLTKKKMPTAPPTLNEIVRLVAQVGGFLGRKSDGEPGVKTIWRGLDQVMTAAETLRALREGLG
ncbi:IS4 family transposase [Massilia cavernae]|uniref:IS4 family transposase n=1 Tax=Massilia cavernae TaxID=2320864 RepID=A0A418XFW2_9BURK|nr:IS4 family transposase [Massilia cavernae]RJG11337.1 IS4 family transposase [Massilia cavernae]RJG11440.1 IS4 family transposase [Massilia cavernae]RJG22399.1 IS4 family transposase [Massilia cavernae]RJG24752.1 IS4 family transposase [Massilia cavernae]